MENVLSKNFLPMAFSIRPLSGQVPMSSISPCAFQCCFFATTLPMALRVRLQCPPCPLLSNAPSLCSLLSYPFPILPSLSLSLLCSSSMTSSLHIRPSILFPSPPPLSLSLPLSPYVPSCFSLSLSFPFSFSPSLPYVLALRIPAPPHPRSAPRDFDARSPACLSSFERARDGASAGAHVAASKTLLQKNSLFFHDYLANWRARLWPLHQRLCATRTGRRHLRGHIDLCREVRHLPRP